MESYQVALAIYLLHAKGIMWMLEQPASSVLVYHRRMQELLKVGIPMYRVHVWLGAFGGTSPKPTVLYSGHPFHSALSHKKLEPGQTFEHHGQMVSVYRDGAGKTRVTGGAKLRESQHYPDAFGTALQELYTAHCGSLQESAGRMPRNVVDADQTSNIVLLAVLSCCYYYLLLLLLLLLQLLLLVLVLLLLLLLLHYSFTTLLLPLPQL